MANDNELEIRLVAVDEASGPIKSALNDINTAQNQVKRTSEETGKSIQEQFRESGRELRQFRQSLTVLTVAFAAVVASTREAAKYNKEAKANFDAFTTSISSLAAMVGTALSPALKAVSVAINLIRDALEAAVAGFIKLFSLVAELGAQVWSNTVGLAERIKGYFQGTEDPMGIVQGFDFSFKKALDIANLASDQFLNNIEQTRAAVESGTTLESQAKETETMTIRIRKTQEESSKKTKEGWTAAKDTVTRFGESLKGAEVINKNFAKAAAAVAIGMAIVNTAVAVTKARSSAPPPLNYILAAIEFAAGAVQIATIASQSFAVGTPNVPSDMMAQIHKGETIIPSTFAESIRRGELSLSGGSGAGAGGGDVTINMYGVNINSKENVRDLAEELGFEISRTQRNARTKV